jgi:hypothetical protein
MKLRRDAPTGAQASLLAMSASEKDIANRPQDGILVFDDTPVWP